MNSKLNPYEFAEEIKRNMQMEQFYEVGADEEVFVVGQIDTM